MSGSGTDRKAPEDTGGTLLDRIALAYARQYPAASGGHDYSGQIFGDYRLVERVGRGGMGEVYRAERADGAFESQVAVKLLRASIDSDAQTRRFSRERQLLARLEHPGIARLLDGGSGPQDIPFLVMEWVDGEPITTHIQRLELNLERRLKLFADVCRAVAYAHRNLIVHRDLKPSNILVTPDSKVKLLDFGIGKLLSDDEDEDQPLTRTGAAPMTQAYAAPEQILGHPVTTATDVFALGVVLYELVTGQRPHRRDAHAPAALAAQVDTEVVTRPSEKVRRQAGDQAARRMSKHLKGDLDTIILTALKREPDRRYASAEAMLEDLRRHADGLPIHARPDTAAYRIGKFVQRHRIGVAFTVLVMLALAGGLAGTLWQAGQARLQTQLAEQEALRAQQSLEFLTGLFQAGDPRAGPRLGSVDELLNSGTERAKLDLAGDPVLQGLVLLRLAEVRFHRWEYAEAHELAQAALALLETRLPEGDERIASAYRLIGSARLRLEPGPEAEASLRRAAAQFRALGDLEQESRALSDVAAYLITTNRFEEAVALQQQIVADAEFRQGAHHPETARRRNDLATFAEEAGDYVLAEAQLRLAIVGFEQAGSESELDLADVQLKLAGLLDRLGRGEDADALFEYGIRTLIRFHGADSAPVASALFSQGIHFLGDRQFVRAEDNFRQVLEIADTTPTTRAHGTRYLGMALRAQGRLEEAISVLHSAEQAYRDLGREVFLLQAHRAAADRGHALALNGNAAVAVSVLAAAVEGIEAARGTSHYELIQPLMHLASVLAENGEIAAARDAAERAARMSQEVMGPEHRLSIESATLHERLSTRDSQDQSS